MSTKEKIESKEWKVAKKHELYTVGALWIVFPVLIILFRPDILRIAIGLCCMLALTLASFLVDLNTMISASLDGRVITLKYPLRAKEIKLYEIDSIISVDSYEIIVLKKDGKRVSIESNDSDIIKRICRWYEQYKKSKK